jgi:hypothetical protein
MHSSHVSRVLAEACTNDLIREAGAARSSRLRRDRSLNRRHRLAGVIAAAVATLRVRLGAADVQ